MKKSILILVGILIAVYIALSLLSTNQEYAAEKIFFAAMQANNKIVLNPEVAPPQLLASVETKLKKIITKYPKTRIVKQVEMALAEFYISNKKFKEALLHLDGLIDKYPQDPYFTCNATFMKGVTYERSGKWSDAVKIFDFIKEKYSNTPTGFQVPIYIARYYENNGNGTAAQQAYLDAIAFYKKLERDNAGQPIGYLASAAMMQIFLQLSNSSEAARVFDETMKNYKAPIYRVQLLQYVDPIFVTKLKKPEKAMQIYKTLQKEIPNKQIKQMLTKKMAQIGKLKK